jgi:3-methyladenine DNA glycosylase/8-oxoguanine DNA glycosylase
MARAELTLVGAGGEPVDFWRTVNSHGLNFLPPARIDDDARTIELTLHPGPRTVVVRETGAGVAAVSGRPTRAVLGAVAHVLRLDEDLSSFYELVAEDPDLAWATRGAGRMMRSATVFEDVVKTSL